jgi:beta-barrel assembly-enhancing protease
MKERTFWHGFIAIVLLNASIYIGCSSGFNVFSKADDIALGQQIQAEIAAHPQEYPVLKDESVRSYVQGIANRILTSPVIENKNFRYQITIINDDKTVNAFALPGGPIYVYTGLIKFVDNEATLAGVIGHEITHGDHRHSTEQMTKAYGISTLSSIVLGNNPSTLAQVASSIAGNLAMLRFSRKDELEADANSFNALNTIPGRPWYPAAIRYFMVKTLTKTGTTSSLEKLFLTHPPSEERLAAIDKLAKEAGLPAPTESALNSGTLSRYKSMMP